VLNLNHKKFIARLAGQLKKVTHFYTGDVDFSLLNEYQSDFMSLNLAKSQVEEVLKVKQDSKGELTEERTAEYEKQLANLEERVNTLNDRYLNDSEAQAQVELKNELEGLALMELASDEKFLKPIFKELGIEVTEYGTVEVAKQITETLRAFFLMMK